MWNYQKYPWSYYSNDDSTQGGGTQDDTAVLGKVVYVKGLPF
jgi:hypothetical protein